MTEGVEAEASAAVPPTEEEMVGKKVDERFAMLQTDPVLAHLPITELAGKDASGLMSRRDKLTRGTSKTQILAFAYVVAAERSVSAVDALSCLSRADMVLLEKLLQTSEGFVEPIAVLQQVVDDNGNRTFLPGPLAKVVREAVVNAIRKFPPRFPLNCVLKDIYESIADYYGFKLHQVLSEPVLKALGLDMPDLGLNVSCFLSKRV